MLDIADKLFPNLLTLLTQLGATGVLYLLYRKYLHEPVMNYLDNQAEEIEEAQSLAENVKKQAIDQERELELAHQKNKEALARSEEAMKREVRKEREEILNQAAEERKHLLEQTEAEIEVQKEEMIIELEEYVLETAASVAERALENYSYDEEEMYKSLEAELEQVKNEAN